MQKGVSHSCWVTSKPVMNAVAQTTISTFEVTKSKGGE